MSDQTPEKELAELARDVRKRVSNKPLKDFHFLHKNWDVLSDEEKKQVADLAKQLDLTVSIPE